MVFGEMVTVNCVTRRKSINKTLGREVRNSDYRNIWYLYRQLSLCHGRFKCSVLQASKQHMWQQCSHVDYTTCREFQQYE